MFESLSEIIQIPISFPLAQPHRHSQNKLLLFDSRLWYFIFKIGDGASGVLCMAQRLQGGLQINSSQPIPQCTQSTPFTRSACLGCGQSTKHGGDNVWVLVGEYFSLFVLSAVVSLYPESLPAWLHLGPSSFPSLRCLVLEKI